MIEFYAADESRTAALARALAGVTGAGDCIALSGDLGTGKTAFARAFIQPLLAAEEEITSPTFTLVHAYDSMSGVPLYHADLYRLETIEETAPLGLEEAWEQGIVLIEWPEIMTPRLPRDRLEVRLSMGATPGERRITLLPHGAWKERLNMVKMPA